VTEERMTEGEAIQSVVDKNIKDKHYVGLFMVFGGKSYSINAFKRNRSIIRMMLKAAQRTYDEVYKT